MPDKLEVTILFDRKTGEVSVRLDGKTIRLPEPFKKTEKALTAAAKYAAKLVDRAG
ncbi:hypothetical protein [Amaricoccus solimangrovi]|uniref:hypothetical protein n=1 Tax=Amaricoccus solimangrovi TaxID=2589815 RepID=UPI0015E435BE|nr:hypothetical protein [Amaricoccus solimangrovi]